MNNLAKSLLNALIARGSALMEIEKQAPVVLVKTPPSVEQIRYEQRKAFVIRLIGGTCFALLTLAAVWQSSQACAAIFALYAGLCAFEFFRMMRADGKSPNMLVGVVVASAFPLCAIYEYTFVGILILFLIVSQCFTYVSSLRVRTQDLCITVFGALYTGFMLSGVVMIRSAATLDIPDVSRALLTIGILFSVWANDSFAYMFGSKFGRHKMVPKISPKKSWEGFAAGMAGSILIWLLFLLIPDLNLTWYLAIIGGAVCGCVGVIGDLVESRIKRGAGVKDSGHILPGHGGMLDRLDSLIFVGMAAFFVLNIGGVL